jgi:hypothetical protein
MEKRRTPCKELHGCHINSYLEIKIHSLGLLKSEYRLCNCLLDVDGIRSWSNVNNWRRRTRRWISRSSDLRLWIRSKANGRRRAVLGSTRCTARSIIVVGRWSQITRFLFGQ